jgi:hypothetical protein
MPRYLMVLPLLLANLGCGSKPQPEQLGEVVFELPELNGAEQPAEQEGTAEGNRQAKPSTPAR